MTALKNSEFNHAITSLVGTPHGITRERAMNNVFVQLVSSKTIENWAWAMANRSNYQDRSGIEDIQQVISEKILVTLRACTPENTALVRDWLKFLHGTAHRAVQDYLASAQVNSASGMSGAARRRAILVRTRKELTTELHREPTSAEIIAKANEWAHAHHKNARKQGILLSAEDFAPTSMAPVSLDESPGVAPGVMNDADMYSEAMLALRRLRTTAAELYPEDTTLERVVLAWVECITQGERPTQPLIVEKSKVTPSGVRSAMVRLNAVLEHVRKNFGDED